MGAEIRRKIQFQRKHITGCVPIFQTWVKFERGITFEDAMKRNEEKSNNFEGFYISAKYGNNLINRSICLALMPNKIGRNEFLLQSEQDRNSTQMTLFYPHTGAQTRLTSFGDLQETALQIADDDAKRYWDALYTFSENSCQHVFWEGSCSARDCDVSTI